MIRYDLKCREAHRFDSWFQNADAFETLKTSGHLMCPTCGTTDVEKVLMTPGVRPSRAKAEMPAPSDGTASATDRERQLAELKTQIETNSDYVGLNFASEARKMHEGEIETRSIYGEARPDEAKKLLEDGVPVAPLPFIPNRKAN